MTRPFDHAWAVLKMADIHFPDGTRITGASQEAADMYAMLMGTGSNWNSATEGKEALERAGISVGGNVETTPVETTPVEEEQRMRAGEEVTRTHDEKPVPFAAPKKKKKIPRRVLVPVVDREKW